MKKIKLNWFLILNNFYRLFTYTNAQKNELSEQGNDITQKLCLVYSSIDQLIVTDQQITSTNSSEDAEDEELNSRKERKTSTSSREEERSQLESSESNSGTSSSTNSHSTNESNSNEDINENILESGCKKENGKILKKELEQNLKVEELYKRIPELETLYATASKNLKQNDKFELMNNQLNDLFSNNKSYTKWNSGRNRLNSKFNRKTSLSARTTPIQHHQLNGTVNGDCEESNRKSFLSNLHSNLVNGTINNSSNNNYYSDADSISYETIDYLGSNSIDSGYKSCKESCCPTPDYHHNHTLNASSIDQRNCRTGGGRFSFDGSSAGFNCSTISQYAEPNNLEHTNDKFIRQYQELIAKSNSSTILKNNLIMMNKNNRLINPNELQQMINDPLHNTSTNAINSIRNSNNGIALKNEIDVLNGQQSLINGHTTFKSALALKLSNSKLNSTDTDYTIGRYNRHPLSQSEQYLNNLDNLNDDPIYPYPYLINSTKRNLFKNRSNLNLEQYIHRIKQQNDLLKQEIEQKEKLNNINDLNLNNQFNKQQTKTVKRKLPQINHLYSRSELVRNRLYACKQMHSSDLNMNRPIDQFETNKYEHQARFRSIYAVNNKLRRQPLSASITQIEQASNLESIYNRLKKPTTLSNSLDGEDGQSLDNDYNQLKSSNLINRNLYSNSNDKQIIDRLYSQVQKNQQKSSSSASIYYQDYLDNHQQQTSCFKNSTNNNTFHSINGPTASLTTLIQHKNSSNDLSIKQEQEGDKRVEQQQRNSEANFESDKNSKEYKTRSTDDLYKSMSDLVNNKFNQLNNANSKRRAFKLTSPLKTLSKAFSSEATDIFKMKEFSLKDLAKTKFANLIDNFASTNSSKKQDKITNKSPLKNASKKSQNKQNANHSTPNDNSNLNEQAGNFYSYDKFTNNSVSSLQKQPLPPVPVVEHLYEELKILPIKERKTDLPEIRVNYYKQRSTASSSNKEDNLTKQSKSLEESTSTSKDQLIDFKQYSRSLDQEYEDEIIRKINSDETIKQIENVISNIDTMLNNKENLNLEFRV